MSDHDFVMLVIAVVVLASSLVSLGLVIGLHLRALPRVEVHAGISGQSPPPLGVAEDECWLELTAVNVRPRQVTILEFHAILRDRQVFELPVTIEGASELAALASKFPCKLDEGEHAEQMKLFRDEVINLDDPRQIEYFEALDSRGRSWKSRRWPLQGLLPTSKKVNTEEGENG